MEFVRWLLVYTTMPADKGEFSNLQDELRLYEKVVVIAILYIHIYYTCNSIFKVYVTTIDNVINRIEC